MVIKVPCEFKRKFERKPHRALVSIAGFGERSGEYYLRDDSVLENWSDRPNPLVDGRLEDWFRGKEDVDYFIHIDLSIRRDRAGFTMGHSKVERYYMDLVFAVDPRLRGEIDIDELINLVITLKNNRGFKIKLVTFDQFQSAFVMQKLQRLGVRTGYLSVDKDTAAYDCWRDALYRDGFDIYDVPLYRYEAKHLIVDGRKVDHLSGKSKDVTDSVAGVCFHLASCGGRKVLLRGVVID